ERVAETRQKVLESVYGSRLNSPSALAYLTGEGAEAPPFVARLETLLWSQLEKAAPGGDGQRAWFDAFARVARSPAALEKLAGLLSGALSVPGLELHQDRRWDVVAQLNRFAAPGARERAAEEAARDKSRRAQTQAIRAEVLRPDWEAKQPWLRKVLENGSIQLADQKAAMRSLFPFEQAALRRRFFPEFYPALKRLSKDRGNEFLDAFAEDMAPATCRAEDSAAIEKFLKGNPQLPAAPRKALRVARQENDRCLKIRRLAADGK
ncbi:MAG: aminopeptidase N, partial [Elusimicrobia bacterium]